jgi:hypothetical protein
MLLFKKNKHEIELKFLLSILKWILQVLWKDHYMNKNVFPVDCAESKMNCQLYIGRIVDIELGNVCKRRLSCGFIYCSPEVKQNVVLSLYTAWRHVREAPPLILNLGHESGCSGSYPGCFTTSLLTNVPPHTTFGHCVAGRLGPRGSLDSSSLRELSHNPRLVHPVAWSVERLSYCPFVWRQWRQDMQCACDVTLSRVRLTIVEVEKQ